MLAVVLAPSAGARHHRHAAPTAPPAAALKTMPPPPETGAPISMLETAPPGADTIVDSTAASDAKAEPTAIVLDTREVQAILGKDVRSSAGEDMGRLVDVLVDRNGQPRAAIIDFGGFLGVGSRKIAVDWGALKFLRDDPKGNIVTVELTRDQVKAAPEFKDGNAVVILGALGSAPANPATPPAPAPPVPAPAAATPPAQDPPKTQEK
ncbi:MAG TPA: PRC-barrel domain-containing protein [Xanthobacteraceae bacterium]